MSKKNEKKKSKQQKPKSRTMKKVEQPKPEEEPTPPAESPGTQPANLCDDCAYEFGECEGVPKFASDYDPNLKGSEADRVVDCKGFLNVQEMPTSDQPPQAGAATDDASSDVKPSEEATPEDELIHVQDNEDVTEEGKTADAAAMTADLEARRKKIQRFQREEDLGACPACGRPLKRTAFNRDRDAVRCTNPRCRQYRAIVRQLKAE